MSRTIATGKRGHSSRKRREPENLGAIFYLLAKGSSSRDRSPLDSARHCSGSGFSPFRRSSNLNNHLTTVATYARADGLSHAALAITDEVLDVVPTLDRPKDIAFAHVYRAKDLIALGRLNAARAELDEALRWVDKIVAGPGHDRTLADVLLVRGEIERAEDPSRPPCGRWHTLLSVYRGLKTDGFLAEALYQEAVAAHGSPATRLAPALGCRKPSMPSSDRARPSLRRDASHAV